ncbi:MAG: Crp/Fnr family transcriptional regulator [Pseudomonadota bacterium]
MLNSMSRGSDYPLTGNFLAGRLRTTLASEDLNYIEDLIEDSSSLTDAEVLIERGQRADISAILVKGFMFRTIERYDKRFIVGIHVPGDFVDLHSFALKRLDHNVVAAGKAIVGTVSHRRIEQAMGERPRIARALWFATLLDAAIHRQWILMHEQLDAPRRIAHIYCELHYRLETVGLASARAIRTPFTQLDLADMIGASAVHTNRAVGKLREIELAQIRRGTLYPMDWKALRDYAQFDAAYLYGNGPLLLNEGWDAAPVT